MTTKEQLIKLVIGNEFITAPRLKKLYLTLLDRLESEKEQCNIANVVGQSEQLVCDICEEPLDKVLGKVCENTMCDRHR